MALGIEELLDTDSIIPALQPERKMEVIQALCKHLAALHPEIDESLLITRVLEREKLGSTGIGDGVAIPHCKMAGIEKVLTLFARSKKGVDFSCVDEKPAHIFFLLVAPENAAGAHLQALAKISQMCRKESFRNSIMKADSAIEIFDIMKREESIEA